MSAKDTGGPAFPTPDFAYVAFKPCGCMVAATVDKPQYQKDNAKSIASWIRDGLRIERLDCERVRVELKFCKCEKKS